MLVQDLTYASFNHRDILFLSFISLQQWFIECLLSASASKSCVSACSPVSLALTSKIDSVVSSFFLHSTAIKLEGCSQRLFWLQDELDGPRRTPCFPFTLISTSKVKSRNPSRRARPVYASSFSSVSSSTF